MTTTSADTSFEFDANLPSTSASSTLGAQSMSNGTRQPFPSSSIELSDDEETEEVVADNEYWTPSELLRELTRTYLDESTSPKLLPEKLDLVDKLRQQTNEIERIMARNSNKKSLAFSTHKLELYRIEFLVNSYLRTRLKKIEQSPGKALHEHAERLRRALTALRAGKPPDQHPELLDGRELQFAEDLQKANSAFFADSFLKHLPSSLQWLPVPWGHSADQSRVFVEVLKDGLEDVPVPNMADPNSEMLVSLEKGSRHMLPFNCIQHFLERGDVRLL